MPSSFPAEAHLNATSLATRSGQRARREPLGVKGQAITRRDVSVHSVKERPHSSAALNLSPFTTDHLGAYFLNFRVEGDAIVCQSGAVATVRRRHL